MHHKTFWQSEYPVYLLAILMGCGEQAVTQALAKHNVKSYKKHGTRFVCRREVVKMISANDAKMQKYFANFCKNN
jgi:hypothetical protein